MNSRILAIAPTTVGFGFAVMEGRHVLVNWGVKMVTGDKNKECFKRTAKLIAEYQPDVIVLEDTLAKESRRSLRIRTLTKKIITLASRQKVKVVLFSQAQVRDNFFGESKATKQALAEIIAARFPEELTHELPAKRRDWESESSRMGIFEAVALALMGSQVKRQTGRVS